MIYILLAPFGFYFIGSLIGKAIGHAMIFIGD